MTILMPEKFGMPSTPKTVSPKGLSCLVIYFVYLLAIKRDAFRPNCVEEDVFYRLISGLHASISIHIAAGYFDKLSNTWKVNSPLYWERVGNYPDRIMNLMFLFSMELKALAKVGDFLTSVYKFETGNAAETEKIQVFLFNLSETNNENSEIQSRVFRKFHNE